MMRRWIIRGLFIFLCTLCISIWVASEFQDFAVTYGGRDYYCATGIRYGWGYAVASRGPSWVGTGWSWKSFSTTRQELLQAYESTTYHAGGFAYREAGAAVAVAGGTYHEPALVMIPLWFPSLVAGLGLWFVWRKTQFKAAGFPVEVGAKRDGE